MDQVGYDKIVTRARARCRPPAQTVTGAGVVARGPWSGTWLGLAWHGLDWIGFGPKSLYFLANPLGFQSVGLPPEDRKSVV